MRPSVYLAGPITGLTYDDGQDWRDFAKSELSVWGIDAFSPLRGKEYLRPFGELSADGTDYKDAGVLSLPEGIWARDKFDCTKRSMVLMNLLAARRVSIGTMIEIGWATGAGIPIVGVMEKSGNVHEHAMVSQSMGWRVTTLAEAIAVVKATLLP